MARLMRFAVIGLLAAATAQAAPGAHWTAAWWSSQMPVEGANAIPAEALRDTTLRQVVRLQVPASQLRVRFSNRYGSQPMTIDSATIALSADPASARIVSGSVRPLRFDGAAAVTIPAGADYWSDPLPMAVRAGGDLAISIHFPEAPAQQTGHPGSRATSYLVRGAHGGDADLPGAQTLDHWYLLTGIETVAPAGRAIVAFGDSITDGHGVVTNSNGRWTDALQRRLARTPGFAQVAVLNAGIGGNRLLNDGLGPNALARFDHDVLSQPGVSHVLVLEGVNDLGTLTRDAPVSDAAHRELVARMIGAYRQMVARAHAHGIKVIGATIMPYAGSGYYHPDARNEADRQAVNAWIRAPGHFDAVIDFDKAMRDPADPTRLRKAYDLGDGLHPSSTGYQAMADAVPLALLR